MQWLKLKHLATQDKPLYVALLAILGYAVPGVSSLSTTAATLSSTLANRNRWHSSLLPISGRGSGMVANLAGPLTMNPAGRQASSSDRAQKFCLENLPRKNSQASQLPPLNIFTKQQAHSASLGVQVMSCKFACVGLLHITYVHKLRCKTACNVPRSAVPEAVITSTSGMVAVTDSGFAVKACDVSGAFCAFVASSAAPVTACFRAPFAACCISVI